MVRPKDNYRVIKGSLEIKTFDHDVEAKVLRTKEALREKTLSKSSYHERRFI